MGAQEYEEWQQFAALEPFGAERDNIHTAILAQLLFNAHKRAGVAAAKLEDFLLVDRQEREAQSRQNVVSFFKGLATRNTTTSKRRKNK